jgi:hypothetical protein
VLFLAAPQPADHASESAALLGLLGARVQLGEGDEAEGQVEEERLAGHGLECRGERHELRLLGRQSGVLEVGVQALTQQLEMRNT